MESGDRRGCVIVSTWILSFHNRVAVLFLGQTLSISLYSTDIYSLIKSTLVVNIRLQRINEPTDPWQTVWKIIEKLCREHSGLILCAAWHTAYRQSDMINSFFKWTTMLSLLLNLLKG